MTMFEKKLMELVELAWANGDNCPVIRGETMDELRIDNDNN